jgi:hypothetical protein
VDPGSSQTKQCPVLGTTAVFYRASCTLSAGPHFTAFAVPLSHLHDCRMYRVDNIPIASLGLAKYVPGIFAT